MDAFNNLLLTLDRFLGGAVWFPYLLLGTGLFFTLYLGVPQVRYFGRAWRVLRNGNDEKGAEGDTSHYQALTTALSGTVGTGNIGGVGLAIYLGGPAALFWMWATAFFGMTTKFVEVSLSHKYREKADKQGIADKGFEMERRLPIRKHQDNPVYAGLIEEMDDAVGQVLNTLEMNRKVMLYWKAYLLGKKYKNLLRKEY